jgi:uncharacterized protein
LKNTFFDDRNRLDIVGHVGTFDFLLVERRGMLVQMSLARIVIVDSEDEKMSMIVLREADGERAFPILIGVHEAYAIDRRTKGIAVQRPLTHDLIERVIDEVDCQLEKIVISELRDSTFYAKLVLRRNGELLEVDSRPSDAIAVGAGTAVPIFVDESVLDEVCPS